MNVGYARFSTKEQHLGMQEDALKSAGCEEIYTDIASGAKSQRPGLEKALAYVREGDTLVVWKLDRLGRSTQHLIQTVSSLNERKIAFKSLQENIDTTSSGGKPSLLDNRQIKRMIEMYDEQKNTVAEICKIYEISRPSFYNYLKRQKHELGEKQTNQ
jgi:DNA invertase Pin-like site-specific DNA recombinase